MLIEVQTLVVIFAQVFLGTYVSPLADTILIVQRSIVQGWRAGSVITLGVCSALVVFVLLVAFGIAATIEAYPKVLVVLQTIGAIYLVTLARETLKAQQLKIIDPSVGTYTNKQLFVRGFSINFLNPMILLYMSFYLPIFVSKEKGDLDIQLLVIGLWWVFSILISFNVLSIAAKMLGHKLSPRFHHWLSYLSAAVIIVIAVYLVIQITTTLFPDIVKIDK
jgi:threonine/homoserine/homoserine lactone efflux protein